MKQIYLDHAATTPVDIRVVEAMLPYFALQFGNASSLHAFGREARRAVEEARVSVARLINAQSEEIIFTSGGTESDNLAITGVAIANKGKGKHIITSSIEHHAVLDTCKHLEEQGFKVTYLPVDQDGLIKIEEVEKAIAKDTILISIMHANNEIGTIEPIREIATLAREKGIYFHTDAVQSAGKIEVDVDKLNVDLLSLSSHKIYGPKGVGALYIKRGTPLKPIIHGGGHERGLRSGTENVPGIVGFGKACEIAREELKSQYKHLISMRDKLIEGILRIPNTRLNGHRFKRLPNNVNCSFSYIDGEALVLALDEYGIAASTGSACSSKSLEPSHVLRAIGLSSVEARGSLRLTLGRQNTMEDIDYLLKVLVEVVERLRGISPLSAI
jgi:cysteine desulfurase